ncbi:amidohydrolase family protein [Petroclostridium sp. X23]|uniref:amidohydrolase family protein n=1 Tax=Petroclostridium sp. X23 TaxID=3045146 RepID=UPI0024AD8860|nr:amidohydrolase family protein [Petroclostridium sp. X23]WHH60302.1 amidohydrolase family protein [Petroclostridium sp. X23]
MAYRIIDFHAHIFPDAVEEKAVRNLGEYYGIPMPCRGKKDDLLKSASKAKVEKLVIHSTATRPGQVENVNSWIASMTNEHIIGFGTLHPDYENIEKEMERIQTLGLKGIKLHPEFQGFDVDEPRMYPLYEAIGDKLPILLHMGDENYHSSKPIKLKNIINRFPNLKVVAAHLGGYSRWDEVKEHLVGENIYMDTSSALWRLSSEEAVEIIKGHGVDRILFGTDFPITSHKDELQRFMKLDLNEEEREKILWKNTYEFLHLSN